MPASKANAELSGLWPGNATEVQHEWGVKICILGRNNVNANNECTAATRLKKAVQKNSWAPCYLNLSHGYGTPSHLHMQSHKIPNSMLLPARQCSTVTSLVRLLCICHLLVILFLLLLRWDTAGKQHLLQELIPVVAHWQD